MFWGKGPLWRNRGAGGGGKPPKGLLKKRELNVGIQKGKEGDGAG